MCPTWLWQVMQETRLTSRSPWMNSMFDVNSPWQVRHDCSTTTRLTSRILMFSGYWPVVNFSECQNPLSASLSAYATTSSCGAWHDWHVVTAWCGPRCQASYCLFIAWHWLQVSDSWPK